MDLVKVISTKIDSVNRRLTKFLRFGNSDIQECLQTAPFGVDSNPTKDMIAIYSNTSTKGKNVILGYINKNQLADIGETRLFSTDSSGVLQQYILLKNDGDINFGGTAGNLTRYQELKTGFDQLKSDVNSLINAFNTHVHPTAAVGPPSPPTPVPSVIPATPSTADIANSKIDQFKTL